MHTINRRQLDVRSRAGAFLLIAIAVIVGLTIGYGQDLASQWAQYEADVPKTIVELQPFRRTNSIAIESARGRHGTATLIDLNPNVGVWYLLEVHWSDFQDTLFYHLENPQPRTQSLSLSEKEPRGILLKRGPQTFVCELWADQRTALEQSRATGLPYSPLCENGLYLRNPVAGTYTKIERVTNFLRDHVWGGERIIGFVRDEFFRDAFIEKNQGRDSATDATVAIHGPRNALLNASYENSSIVPTHLDIDVGQRSGGLLLGRWYEARASPGIFVSAIPPEALDRSIFQNYRNVVADLDSVESDAVDYLVAMDSSRFDLGFALGTDHPRVGWSERASVDVRRADLPGPDGIATVAPLVVNGMVDPALVSRTAVTFTGGFKRSHGAFRAEPFAHQNKGSHYGFIEHGVILSKLQPGLATLYVTDAGLVEMKTWMRADNENLAHIRFARQNGLPLIDYDAKFGTSTPGAYVNRWVQGNWSGSSEEKLRTLRAGACIQEATEHRFLIYGYFSTATPSAMARVFQAYGCKYAMHLDMNALEHTYFALYTHRDGRIGVQHLIQGMAEVDRKGGNQFAPRFLSFPDDRDFFYLTRKSP